MFSYEYWMGKALILARKSYEIGEIPVGCLVVKDDTIIGEGYNLTEGKRVVNHAEILAITSANDYLNNWRLLDCNLYVTLEPCMMCVGAINNSRLKKVVYGAKNNNFGAIQNLNSKIQVVSGILEKECSKILQDFFKNIRKFKQQNSKCQSKTIDIFENK